MNDTTPARSARKHVKYPLVVKLIGIISIIVVVTMGVITGISSWFFSEDSRARAEENSLTVSQVLATQIEGRLDATLSGSLSLLDTLRESAGNKVLETTSVSNWFSLQPSVLKATLLFITIQGMGFPGLPGCLQPNKARHL